MKVNLGKYPSNNEDRKVDVAIEPHDTYSFDHTLALIILPGLLQLRATQHGIPTEFADVGGDPNDSQSSFDFYIETHNASFDKGVEKWHEILDKMIWSFQQIVADDYDEKYHHGTPKFDWEPDNDTYTDPVTGKSEKLFRMVDKNPDEHWYDMEGAREHERRIQEGLELFGKYFKNLWD